MTLADFNLAYVRRGVDSTLVIVLHFSSQIICIIFRLPPVGFSPKPFPHKKASKRINDFEAFYKGLKNINYKLRS